MILIYFENTHVATVDVVEQVQRAMADHIGTWAGNGTTARIIERQACDHNTDVGHCIQRIHVESWHRCVLSMFRYYIFEK